MSKVRMACALQCQQGNVAPPTLSLLAGDRLAEKVISLAHRYKVPVLERPELVRALSQLEIDSEIPPSLFKAVAVLISQLSHLKPSRR